MIEERTQADAEFARRMTAFGGDLFRIARAMLADDHLAEDAVAQTYLAAWQQRQTLRSDQKLVAWLKRICRNEARDILADLRRERVRIAGLAARERGTSSQLRAWESELRGELLAGLPGALKVCAEMYFFDGMSYSEIASVTALPLSTVRGRIHQSRRQLRREIEMTSQIEQPASKAADVIVARGDRIEWRGARIRFLGSFWGGQTTLYDAAGKRLSRRPAALTEEAVRRASHWTFDSPHARPVICLAWELKGNPVVCMGTDACGHPSGTDCQPCREISEGQDGRKAVIFIGGGPAEGDQHVQPRSWLWGEPNRDSVEPFRFIPGPNVPITGGIATSPASFGAVYMCPPRREGRGSSSEMTVAFSARREFEKGTAVFAVDSEGREVGGQVKDGAGAACAEGHLRVLTLRFPMKPRDIRGLVIYALHGTAVEWRRFRLPPRP